MSCNSHQSTAWHSTARTCRFATSVRCHCCGDDCCSSFRRICSLLCKMSTGYAKQILKHDLQSLCMHYKLCFADNSSSAVSRSGKGHKCGPAASDAMLAPLAPLGFQALSETSSNGSSSLNGPFHTYAGLLLLIALALCKTSLTIADLNLHTTMLCHNGNKHCSGKLFYKSVPVHCQTWVSAYYVHSLHQLGHSGQPC